MRTPMFAEDCRQAYPLDVKAALRLTDRKQVQLQLSACHRANSRVNLVNYARAVWAVEDCNGLAQRLLTTTTGASGS